MSQSAEKFEAVEVGVAGEGGEGGKTDVNNVWREGRIKNFVLLKEFNSKMQ